jgi:unspecific monooxygenase
MIRLPVFVFGVGDNVHQIVHRICHRPDHNSSGTGQQSRSQEFVEVSSLFYFFVVHSASPTCSFIQFEMPGSLIKLASRSGAKILIRISQAPTDKTFVQDPYNFYATARSLGDFVEWQDFGIAMATTAEAVNAVMRHPKLGRKAPVELKSPVPAGLEPFYRLEEHSMLELEPPDHTRLRGLVLRSFTRNRVLALAPYISQTADDLIDCFREGPFDLLDAFARVLPVRVIAHLLGVPQDMTTQLLLWSNDMVAMYQARRNGEIEARAARAAAEFTDYIASLLKHGTNLSPDSLLSKLTEAAVDGRNLTTDEVVATAILLLNAGHEATVHSIGNAIRHLSDYPERTLALTPEFIEGTVEECLRFDPPLHMFRRWVYEDVTMMGYSFRRGQEIGCLLGSACRDDAVWPDGEVFDPFRMKRPNLAFGAGIHFCVGAPLARLELQIALPALFSRCPNIKVVTPPQVANLYHFRGLESLMVTV